MLGKSVLNSILKRRYCNNILLFFFSAVQIENVHQQVREASRQ